MSEGTETAPHVAHHTNNNLSDSIRLGKVCHHMALIDDSQLHSAYCCLHLFLIPDCFLLPVKVNMNSHRSAELKLWHTSQNICTCSVSSGLDLACIHLIECYQLAYSVSSFMVLAETQQKIRSKQMAKKQ